MEGAAVLYGNGILRFAQADRLGTGYGLCLFLQGLQYGIHHAVIRLFERDLRDLTAERRAQGSAQNTAGYK